MHLSPAALEYLACARLWGGSQGWKDERQPLLSISFAFCPLELGLIGPGAYCLLGFLESLGDLEDPFPGGCGENPHGGFPPNLLT